MSRHEVSSGFLMKTSGREENGGQLRRAFLVAVLGLTPEAVGVLTVRRRPSVWPLQLPCGRQEEAVEKVGHWSGPGESDGMDQGGGGGAEGESGHRWKVNSLVMDGCVGAKGGAG